MINALVFYPGLQRYGIVRQHNDNNTWQIQLFNQHWELGAYVDSYAQGFVLLALGGEVR